MPYMSEQLIETLQVRVTADERAALVVIANHEARTVSYLIRQAIRAYLQARGENGK